MNYVTAESSALARANVLYKGYLLTVEAAVGDGIGIDLVHLFIVNGHVIAYARWQGNTESIL
jgi:hypothetical protein